MLLLQLAWEQATCCTETQTKTFRRAWPPFRAPRPGRPAAPSGRRRSRRACSAEAAASAAGSIRRRRRRRSATAAPDTTTRWWPRCPRRSCPFSTSTRRSAASTWLTWIRSTKKPSFPTFSSDTSGIRFMWVLPIIGALQYDISSNWK